MSRTTLLIFSALICVGLVAPHSVDVARREAGELDVNDPQGSFVGSSNGPHQRSFDLLSVPSGAPQGGPQGSNAPQGGPQGSNAPHGGPQGSNAPQGGPQGSNAPQGGPQGSNAPQDGPHGGQHGGPHRVVFDTLATSDGDRLTTSNRAPVRSSVMYFASTCGLSVLCAAVVVLVRHHNRRREAEKVYAPTAFAESV